MEDSARFLYLAGGILVGILILTLAVYLFANFSGGATNVENQIAADQIEQFNSPYVSYREKEGITIYDIVNLARKARDYNERNGVSYTTDSGHISVIRYDAKRQFELKNGKDLTNTTLYRKDDSLINDFLIADRNEITTTDNRLPQYICPGDGIEYYEWGKIKKISFYKK